MLRGCSELTSLTIPGRVTSIGRQAFDECSKLKQLILFPSTPPSLGSVAIPDNVQTIYVPQESNESYKSANDWTALSSKIVSDNLYLSFARFNTKNKEYIDNRAKLYNHAIYYFISDTDLSVTINVITSSSTSFTQFSEFKSLIENKVATITGPEFCGAAAATTTADEVWIRGGGASGSDTTTYATIDKKLDSSSFSSDTVTEI